MKEPREGGKELGDMGIQRGEKDRVRRGKKMKEEVQRG